MEHKYSANFGLKPGKMYRTKHHMTLWDPGKDTVKLRLNPGEYVMFLTVTNAMETSGGIVLDVKVLYRDEVGIAIILFKSLYTSLELVDEP